MALFSSFPHFKAHISGAANVSLELESLQRSIRSAGELHVAPWLGLTLLEKLSGDYNALIAEEKLLVPHVQRPVAALAMYEYSHIGGIQFSESGMHRATGENLQSAFKYQETEYRLKMREEGYEGIDAMLKYLQKNFSDFPDWVAEVQENHNATFVRYASDFRMHYSSMMSRFTYDCLRPLLLDVETFALESTLPLQFLSHLRTAYFGGSATTFEKKAVFLAQRAVVHFTLTEALERNQCEVRGNSVIFLEMGSDQSSIARKPALDNMTSLKRKHHDITANRHLKKLKDYINENAAEFPLAFCEADGGTNTDSDAWCSSTETTDDDCCSTRPVAYFDCGCSTNCTCGCTTASKKILVL